MLNIVTYPWSHHSELSDGIFRVECVPSVLSPESLILQCQLLYRIQSQNPLYNCLPSLWHLLFFLLSSCKFPNLFFRLWISKYSEIPCDHREQWLQIISLQGTCIRLRISKFLLIIHGCVTAWYIHDDPHAVTNMWKSESNFVESVCISHFYIGSKDWTQVFRLSQQLPLPILLLLDSVNLRCSENSHKLYCYKKTFYFEIMVLSGGKKSDTRVVQFLFIISSCHINNHLS